jgi:hydrogenase nickel incorporation protein HypB
MGTKWRSVSRVSLEKKVLSENDRIATELRERFREHGTLCLNLISAPGSGKTTLLEKTLESLSHDQRVAVLTGDIQTENDATRLRCFGFPVKQITTSGTCHLDARMIKRHLADWQLQDIDLLFIENVGNLVCPSSYDLGEAAKIVLLSVTEGEDKPLKYPSIFFKSELLIITKTDLLPYVPFNLGAAEENACRVHPEMEIVKVSCTSGDGLQQWLTWLQQRKRAQQTARSEALV